MKLLTAFLLLGSVVQAETLLVSMSAQFLGAHGDTDRTDTSDSFQFCFTENVCAFRVSGVDWSDPAPIPMTSLDLPTLNHDLHFEEPFGFWSFELPWSPQGYYTPHVMGLDLADAWSDGTATGSSNIVGHENVTFTIESHYTPPNGINLHGSPVQITGAILEITDFQSTLLGDGEFSSYDIGFTVHLLGTIPEPSTLALLAPLGLLLIVVRKRVSCPLLR